MLFGDPSVSRKLVDVGHGEGIAVDRLYSGLLNHNDLAVSDVDLDLVTFLVAKGVVGGYVAIIFRVEREFVEILAELRPEKSREIAGCDDLVLGRSNSDILVVLVHIDLVPDAVLLDGAAFVSESYSVQVVDDGAVFGAFKCAVTYEFFVLLGGAVTLDAQHL